ncbi:MAG: hypothetical protein AAB535_03855 [Patescibacteria group bacterium]
MGKDIFREFDEELAGIIEHERGFVGYIAQVTGGASEGEIERVAKLHAIERMLDPDGLNQIGPWDENTAELLVRHLDEEGYERELQEWISDPDRFDLDPERVEEVEREVRKIFDLEPFRA